MGRWCISPFEFRWWLSTICEAIEIEIRKLKGPDIGAFFMENIAVLFSAFLRVYDHWCILGPPRICNCLYR